MASRQQEKERRREERLAAERAAAAAAARQKRVRMAGASLLAVAAVVGVVLAIVSGGGDSGPKQASGGKTVETTAALPAAAQKAGCVLTNPDPGPAGIHTTKKGIKYNSNPTIGGPHNPVWASDGNYVGQGTPQVEMQVHTLEHGRIDIQYRPGTPKAVVDQLEGLFNEAVKPYDAGQYLLLFENTTKMPYEVAATAWGHLLGCKKWTAGVPDAIRAFRVKYSLKGPEVITQAE